MMDMSRAFDTVSRSKLMDTLSNVLERDELHMMKLLIQDVQFIVRCGIHTGEPFTTNIGTPQGDCLSPILFILYLAEALGSGEHAVQDHDYCLPPEHSTINEQYADDLGWITNGPSHIIDDIKRDIPPKLSEYGLQVNPDKNEEFSVEYKGDSFWKTIKILGSKIDTIEDFKMRKAAAMEAMDKLSDIWKNNKLTTNMKLRFFNAYVESIFLYNSELWTVTSALCKQIDSFQRRLLRYMLNIKYPRIVTNEQLKRKITYTKWSSKVRTRRLRWTGHLLRLPDSTAAKKALVVAEQQAQHRRGRRIHTWLSLVKTELNTLGLDWEGAKLLAMDRNMWRQRVVLSNMIVMSTSQ